MEDQKFSNTERYNALLSTVSVNQVLTMSGLNFDTREVIVKHIDGVFWLLDDDVLLPMLEIMDRSDIKLHTKDYLWIV